MAQPPPQAWYPPVAPRAPSQNPALIALVVGIIVIVAFFVVFVSILLGTSGAVFPLAFAPFMCIPLIFIIVFIIIAATSASRPRRIPPPPPIQQPMVPAGQQGPVPLDCPNCGGPPTNVDRFGIATCGYCGTRFLVR